MPDNYPRPVLTGCWLICRGKLKISLPPRKKSALDKARNREAIIASQLCTNHSLSGVYLKRIGKRDTAGSWFCGDTCQPREPPKMTRTHVLLDCPAFEDARCEAWKDPTTGASPGLDQLAPY
jgi:hypothetical protein